MSIRLLYAHMGNTTFVRRDKELFARHYAVTESDFSVQKKWQTPLAFLRQFWLLLTTMRRTDLYVSYFAGYHSFLPGVFAKLSGKPFLVIAAQTESISYPSIQYGNYHKPVYGLFTKWSLRMANHITPVHKTLIESRNTYYPNDGEAQGIKHFVPNIKAAFTEIPYGFDPAGWKANLAKTPNTFITVAHIWNHARYVLKGVDLILEVAPLFPQCHFTVIGLTYVPPIAIPENVTVSGLIPNEEVKLLLQKTQFHLQLSISEGHPNALCEAMLSNCIPIGSAAASMPETIGDTGFIVAKRSAAEFRAVLEQALAHPDKAALAQAARARIVANYPLSRRENAFIEVVEGLTRR